MIILPTAILADDVTAAGEIPAPPPPYNMLRFDENYSCLANPANRTDWFDSDQILSRCEPMIRPGILTFGGELRERFEGNYDPNFGIGGAGADSYLLQRITLLTDLHLGERVRFFVGRHLRSDGRRVAARAAGAAGPD